MHLKRLAIFSPSIDFDATYEKAKQNRKPLYEFRKKKLKGQSKLELEKMCDGPYALGQLPDELHP